MTQFFALCLASSLGGLIMTAGGIWLIYKEKIYIDRETKERIEVELPLGVKLKTNVPALVLFLVGLVLMFYPIRALEQALYRQQVELAGRVDGDSFPVEIQVVVSSENLHQPGPFSLVVPRLAENMQTYKVVYLAGGHVFDNVADLHQIQRNKLVLEPMKIHMDKFTLQPMIIQAGSTDQYRPLDPLPPVPSDFGAQGNN